MELEFTTDQEELRDSVRAVLARECTPGFVRAVAEQRIVGAHVGTEPLWSHMVDLGWPALTIPEAAGGLGFGAVELAVLVEALGQAMAPGPLLPTVSQFVPAVREAGSAEQQDTFLRPVAEAGRTGSLALDDPPGVVTTASRRGDNRVLAGEKRLVVEAPAVDNFVVVASTDDGALGAFVVASDASGVHVEPVRNLDPTRLIGSIVLQDTTVEPTAVLGQPGPATADAIRRAVEEATVALALETVGATQTIFDVTLAYAKEREQFGVPIGSFQAIKHKFADMLIAIERARATGYFAALTIAEDDDRRTMATSMAKTAAGDAQRLVGKEGIQIHGGIGYTWEHDIHLYVRRAKADAALFGTATAHRARVADLLDW
ncbi:MAG: acyl-CoA dehydrogenase family protein [Acidimicrobiia bacterium]